MRCAFVYIFISTILSASAQNLVINEAMNNAFVSVEDSDGDFPNWVEIYNPLPVAVNLSDYFLSPAANDLMRYQLPDSTLFPGEYTLVLLSGKDRKSDFIHANFSWRDIQRRLYLSDRNGQSIDEIFMPNVPYDKSFGRETDGGASFITFNTPSPGSSNNGNTPFTPLNEGLFVWPPNGWYNTDSIRVEISASTSDIDLHYTLDGRTPTINSPKYEGAFWLLPNPVDTFYYASIRTNPLSTNSRWNWREPRRMPSKSNVLSVAAFRNGVQVSPTENRHWFIGREKPEHDEAVVSIVSDPDGLFGYENGIFVGGKVYHEGPGTSWDWGVGNYHERGRTWERLAHISMFNNTGSEAFSQSLGIRIHGGGSRALPMKSLRLYPRGIYGENRIRYSIFPERNQDEYNRVLLRNGGQEFMRTHFVDAMASELSGKLGLEHQAVRTVTHYINGEYWGVINFRERIDESFISYTKDIPEEEVFLTMFSSSNWSKYDGRWSRFTNDLDITEDPNEIEALVRQHLDIENFIDYFLFRVYIGVYDWPGNNRALWRTKSDTSLYRNVVFDSDGAFDDYAYNHLEHATTTEGSSWPNPPWSTLVFRKMMTVENIQLSILERLEELIMSEFHPDTLDALHSKYIRRYDPLMPHHIDRWQFPSRHIDDWYESLSNISTFVNQRPCYIRTFFREAFDLDDTYLDQYECDENGFVRPKTAAFNAFIYPNPNNGQFNIDVNMTEAEQFTITLINMVGQTLFERTFFRGEKQFTHRINVLEHQPPGNYILRISNGVNSSHHRIIKQ